MAVDISSKSGYPAGMLSNFTPYTFTFRGREFCSIESLLQGLKFETPEKQDKIFKLVGKDAKRKGKECKWYLDQTLYWQGTRMKRDSAEYMAFVKEAFDALSENKDFQKTLLSTGNKTLCHTIGESDPTRTVLTEKEFCDILTDIRTRLQNNMEKNVFATSRNGQERFNPTTGRRGLE